MRNFNIVTIIFNFTLIVLSSNSICTAHNQNELPLKISACTTDSLNPGKIFNLSICVDIQESWYIYAPTGNNFKLGMFEAQISFELPIGITLEDKIMWPVPTTYDIYEVYKGKIKLNPKLNVNSTAKPGLYFIKLRFKYQGCNSITCLPPIEEIIYIKLNITQLE